MTERSGTTKRISVLRAATTLKSNPFVVASKKQGVVEEKEEGGGGGLRYWETVKDELRRIFIKHLPHDFIRSLPPVYQYCIGGFLYACIISIASLFFYFSFKSSRSYQFLSPISTKGLCQSIQKPADGTFYADTNGHWEHQSGFEYSKALYKVQFSNFTSGDKLTSYQLFGKLFKSVENTFQSFLVPIANVQNLASNLRDLCTSLFIAETKSLSGGLNQQSFQLTGDPTSIFNLPYITAGLADSDGLCMANATVQLLKAEKKWHISWNSKDYSNDANCMRALKPSLLGHVDDINQISLSIDPQSLIALAAIDSPDNSGAPYHSRDDPYSSGNVYFKDVMKEVPGTSKRMPLGMPPIFYRVAKYYDFRFPAMDPVLCISKTIKTQNQNYRNVTRCVLPLGHGSNYFGYPYFDHFGANKAMIDSWYGPDGEVKSMGNDFFKPFYCNCTSQYAHGMNGNGKLDLYGFKNCNQFDFLHGLIVFKFEKPQNGGNLAAGLIKMMFEDENELIGSTISRRAYNAAWYTVPHLRETGEPRLFYEHVYRSPADRKQDFSFCTSQYGSCAMLMMRSTSRNDYVVDYHTVNDYFLQVNNGSCNGDYLYTKNFSKIGINPPVPLDENYYVCSSSLEEAFTQAVATAFGNTAISIPVVVLIFVHIFFFLQNIFRFYIPRTYTREEKEEIMDGIAVRLMLLRDSRQLGNGNTNAELLKGLLGELQQTHDSDELYFLRAHEKELINDAERKREDKTKRALRVDELWTTTLQLLGRVRSQRRNRTDDNPMASSTDETHTSQSRRDSESVVEQVNNPMRFSNHADMSDIEMSTAAPKLSKLTRSHMPKIIAMRKESVTIVPFSSASSASKEDYIPTPIISAADK